MSWQALNQKKDSMTYTEQELDKKLDEIFDSLPPVVQQAITSADTTKLLRELADSEKLHLDQWQTLENEVFMALYGLKPAANLQASIQKEVGVSPETAVTLTQSINRIVFEPIRQELERELGHPKAKDEEVSDIEKVRDIVLAQAEHAPVVAPVHSGTPPAPKPEGNVLRGPASGAYVPGQTSVERKIVIDDPYRESTQ